MLPKFEVKDDFVRYCFAQSPCPPEPITQSGIDETWNAFIGVLYQEREIPEAQARQWLRDGSGFTVSALTKRMNEPASVARDRAYRREYRKYHPQ